MKKTLIALFLVGYASASFAMEREERQLVVALRRETYRKSQKLTKYMIILNAIMVAGVVADYCTSMEADKKPAMLGLSVVTNGLSLLFGTCKWCSTYHTFKLLDGRAEPLLQLNMAGNGNDDVEDDGVEEA